MTDVIIGAGMSGLIASRVSGYKALLLESKPKLNTNFGDMVGARFVHDSPPEMGPDLFDLLPGPLSRGYCEVTSDVSPVNVERVTEDYSIKTRRIIPDLIPLSERESIMNWGVRGFYYFDFDINAWAKQVAAKSGVVMGMGVERVFQEDDELYVLLENGQTIDAKRVIFTIPLPIMAGLADCDEYTLSELDDFRTYPTTVGRFRTQAYLAAGRSILHYITSPTTKLTRITLKGSSLVVEASSEQTPSLIGEMAEAASNYMMGKNCDALGFGTFGHHFQYFPGFIEKRNRILHALAKMNILPLGRYAAWSHRIKIGEVYTEAKKLWGAAS